MPTTPDRHDAQPESTPTMPDADRRRIVMALATLGAVAVPAAKVLLAKGENEAHNEFGSS